LKGIILFNKTSWFKKLFSSFQAFNPMIRRIAYFFGLGAMVLACGGPTASRKPDAERPVFKTRADTELYFKNVRQIDYTLSAMSAAGMNKYSYQYGVAADSTRPQLHWVILHNWRQNEAYIWLEAHPFWASWPQIAINWKDPATSKQGTFTLPKPSKEGYYQLATHIYQAVEAKHTLQVVQGGQNLPFLQEEKERQAFRKVMQDYYKLVGFP
jgi:hypothetical protein